MTNSFGVVLGLTCAVDDRSQASRGSGVVSWLSDRLLILFFLIKLYNIVFYYHIYGDIHNRFVLNPFRSTRIFIKLICRECARRMFTKSIRD